MGGGGEGKNSSREHQTSGEKRGGWDWIGWGGAVGFGKMVGMDESWGGMVARWRLGWGVGAGLRGDGISQTVINHREKERSEVLQCLEVGFRNEVCMWERVEFL